MEEDPLLKKEFDEKEPKKVDIDKKIEAVVEKAKVSLNVFCSEIERILKNQGISERNSEKLADLAFEKAVEIERMFNALKDHPALKSFVKEGYYLQNEDSLKIYFPNGKDFLKDIMTGLQSETVGFPALKKWQTHREDYARKFTHIEYDIKERFLTLFDTFSKILKREPVPVMKWSAEKKDWEKCEEVL